MVLAEVPGRRRRLGSFRKSAFLPGANAVDSTMTEGKAGAGFSGIFLAVLSGISCGQLRFNAAKRLILLDGYVSLRPGFQPETL